MTTKPQLQTEADQLKPKEVTNPDLKITREWKFNLVGVYFKTFETTPFIGKEPPQELVQDKTKKFVLINFGMVLDERNVERGLATYDEDVGEWPKLYKESLE